MRCIQTLEPLAKAHDLQVETADELEEGAPAEGALELALSLAGDSSGGAVLCTHGDVMAFAVEALLVAGIPLEGPLEFRKGASWVLEAGADGFERGHYVPPPPKKDALG